MRIVLSDVASDVKMMAPALGDSGMDQTPAPWPEMWGFSAAGSWAP